MTARQSHQRVLAIDPTSRGFGYVVLEADDLLVDWGARQLRGEKNTACVAAVMRLIERYEPDLLVLEDGTATGSRRCQRVQQLIDRLAELARRNGIRVRWISRVKVKKAFASLGASTKHQIALAIAARFPELAYQLPRARKPWMSEDCRMAIFDAAAFALAFF